MVPLSFKPLHHFGLWPTAEEECSTLASSATGQPQVFWACHAFLLAFLPACLTSNRAAISWPRAACLNPGAIPFPLLALFFIHRTPAEPVGALPPGHGATLSALCPPSAVLSAVCPVWGASSGAFPLPPPWGARAQEGATLIPATWLSLDRWGLERRPWESGSIKSASSLVSFFLASPVRTHGIVHGTGCQSWPGAPQHCFVMLLARPSCRRPAVPGGVQPRPAWGKVSEGRGDAGPGQAATAAGPHQQGEGQPAQHQKHFSRGNKRRGSGY